MFLTSGQIQVICRNSKRIIYGDTLYERVNDVKYIARFDDNTDENLTFESEGFYLLGAATNDALMVLRLIKLK